MSPVQLVGTGPRRARVTPLDEGSIRSIRLLAAPAGGLRLGFEQKHLIENLCPSPDFSPLTSTRCVCMMLIEAGKLSARKVKLRAGRQTEEALNEHSTVGFPHDLNPSTLLSFWTNQSLVQLTAQSMSLLSLGPPSTAIA